MSSPIYPSFLLKLKSANTRLSICKCGRQYLPESYRNSTYSTSSNDLLLQHNIHNVRYMYAEKSVFCGIKTYKRVRAPVPVRYSVKHYGTNTIYTVHKYTEPLPRGTVS